MPDQNIKSLSRRLTPATFIASPTKFILVLSAIFALASLSACGEEPNKKPNVIINNNQGNNDKQDVGHNDTGDTDTVKNDVDEFDDIHETDTKDQDTRPETDTPADDDTNVPPDTTCGDSCITGEICVAGECVADTADRKCRDATNLGQLKLGVKKTASGTLRRASDVITCRPGEFPTCLHPCPLLRRDAHGHDNPTRSVTETNHGRNHSCPSGTHNATRSRGDPGELTKDPVASFTDTCSTCHRR